MYQIIDENGKVLRDGFEKKATAANWKRYVYFDVKCKIVPQTPKVCQNQQTSQQS